MGDVGDDESLVATVVVVVVVVKGFSKREMRPREPSKTLFDVDC